MRLDIDPRLPMNSRISIQLDYARELFEAINADGDKPKGRITFSELEGLQAADTFARFLKINNMHIFDEVVR